MLRSALSALLLFSAALVAQTFPTLSVDAAANRHPISPDIYGINDYSDHGLADVVRVGVRRWGGDATSRYNWQNDTYNSASDYYFENYAYPSGSLSQFDQFVETGLKTGTKRLGTIPMNGWLPKSRDNSCSYSEAKYGPQQKVDPYHLDCGNGYLPDGKTKITGNDPSDTSVLYDSSFAQQWIEHLISIYGTAQRGGVQIWSLDNEPEWWFAVHMDIHPSTSTYDEMIQKGQTYAAAIKQADPTALVTGPVAAGWSGMFYSATDFVSGWSTAPYQFYDNPIDRMAHGNVPFVEWYLQQMRDYEAAHGLRLLDYVDVHAYIAPGGISFGERGDDTNTALRLTSTRVFWDPNYAAPDASTPDEGYPSGVPPYLVPRMLHWVAADYPGTKTAITEYNWGALDDITGAVAQADILGIFGREGLDLATLWGPPDASKPEPGVFAFRMFLNYDGNGNQFGETSVSSTTSDPDQISIFSAQRADGALTIMLLNKTSSGWNAPVSISNFAGSGTAQVWQYSGANLTAIQRGADLTVSNGQAAASLPPYSLTLLVLPQDPALFGVPKPVIGAVTNAASYNSEAIAPGEIATIFGTNLGPANLIGAALTSDGGYLTTQLGTTRVLFNGVAAPLIYSSATQLSALVPYQTELTSNAAVQVEVNGFRSDSFTIPVVAADPALLSHDASGKGQGAILNQDLSLNTSAHPARPGDIVVLYATGEGVTNPPGVNGRLAIDTLPVPVGTCAVTIGGVAAIVSFCGAAPYLTSGLLQINVQVPATTSPGNAPITFSIGGTVSNANVTVAIQ